jgi:hypothetical protein
VKFLAEHAVEQWRNDVFRCVAAPLRTLRETIDRDLATHLSYFLFSLLAVIFLAALAKVRRRSDCTTWFICEISRRARAVEQCRNDLFPCVAAPLRALREPLSAVMYVLASLLHCALCVNSCKLIALHSYCLLTSYKYSTRAVTNSRHLRSTKKFVIKTSIMKKIIALTAVASLLFCTAFAQKDKEKNKEKYKDENAIKGSGNVVTRDVPVQSFDELDASGVYQLTLIQGGKEGVKIEADDNLQELFEVKNEGSKLVVSMKKDSHYDTKNKIKVSINFKQLKSLNLKVVGNVSSQGNLNFGDLSWNNKSVGNVTLAFNAKKLDLDNKSVGQVNLSGKANEAVIRNKSVGSLNAGSFVVETMDINNDGIGGAEVNATKEFKVKENSMGRVKNVGSASPKKKIVI